MEELKLDSCPACESAKIRHKKGTLKRSRKGREVHISGATYWECDDCGQRVFTLADMRRKRKLLDRRPIAA